MHFFLHMNPPTTTAQMKKVRVVKNKPIFYEPENVKNAHRVLLTHLAPHKPETPLDGAIALKVLWLFPRGKSHKHGQWRTTRPDTDNLQKMLKDSMTRIGFWKDDAQVAREIVEKRWSDEPTGIYIEIDSLQEEPYVQK